MKIKINIKTQAPSHDHDEDDYQHLIDLFGLLLEWDMQDVQEKKEERKKVSQEF